MRPFAILVKSHAPDLVYVDRLLASFRRHNRDDVAAFLCVPDADLAAFGHLAGPDVVLVPESEFAAHLVTQPTAGFSAGYVNQEIIKLCFWESGRAANYLCLDSDAEFIRDFRRSDFMADDATPFTFLSEDAELRIEPEYHRVHWKSRAEHLDAIRAAIGLGEQRLLTVHGHAVFSAAVLGSFVERFLEPRGWDYADAVALAPFEPTWYSMWLQFDRTIPIIERQPIIRTIHNGTQHLGYAIRGLGSADLARGYVAVVVNSNYSRGEGMVALDDPLAETLSSFVTTRDLLAAIGHRIAWRARGHGAPATSDGSARRAWRGRPGPRR